MSLENDLGVKEATDFWGGTVVDAKEMSNLKPTTKDVKMLIKDVQVFNTDKEGNAKDWKQIKVSFVLTDGLMIGDETKYKGSSMTESFVYFANPQKYDMTKPFYSKGSFLVPIKQLVLATGVQAPSLVLGGITDESINNFACDLIDKSVLGTIMQVKVTAKDEISGKYEPTGELKNEIKNFKKLPDSAMV